MRVVLVVDTRATQPASSVNNYYSCKFNIHEYSKRACVQTNGPVLYTWMKKDATVFFQGSLQGTGCCPHNS